MKIYATGYVYEINDNNTFNATVYYDDGDEEWWEEITESSIIPYTKHFYEEGAYFKILINDAKKQLFIHIIEPYFFTQKEIEEAKKRTKVLCEFFKDAWDNEKI